MQIKSSLYDFKLLGSDRQTLATIRFMETVDRCPVSRINFLYLITASSVGYDISVTYPYFIDQNKSEKYKKKTLPFLFTAKLDRLFEFSHLTARQSYSAVPGPSIFFIFV